MSDAQNPSPIPIQLPVQAHVAVDTKTGRFSLIQYRWAQAITNFMGSGRGTNVPATATVAFMALRRSS